MITTEIVMDLNSKMFCDSLAAVDVEGCLNSGNFGTADLELALYDLSDMLEGQELSDVLADIFGFYEKHPKIELGSPGPLATLVENSSKTYVPALLTSLGSKPTYVTVNMLARVVNTDINDADRARYLGIINVIAHSAEADEAAVAAAKEYLEHRALTWGETRAVS
ncbi:MAG: hypothetical protein ACI80S_000005 [Pseudohongiellaceae bacterium]